MIASLKGNKYIYNTKYKILKFQFLIKMQATSVVVKITYKKLSQISQILLHSNSQDGTPNLILLHQIYQQINKFLIKHPCQKFLNVHIKQQREGEWKNIVQVFNSQQITELVLQNTYSSNNGASPGPNPVNNAKPKLQIRLTQYNQQISEDQQLIKWEQKITLWHEQEQRIQKKLSSDFTQIQDDNIDDLIDLGFFYAQPLYAQNKSDSQYGAVKDEQVLFLAETQKIQKKIKQNINVKRSANIEIQVANVQNLQAALSKGVKMLHFSCHGKKNSLTIQSHNVGIQKNLTSQQLIQILKQYKTPQIIIFNACHSQIIAQKVHTYFYNLGRHITTVGYEGEIDDLVCQLFAQSFYQNIFNSRTVQYALKYSSKTDHEQFRVFYSPSQIKSITIKASNICERDKYVQFKNKTDTYSSIYYHYYPKDYLYKFLTLCTSTEKGVIQLTGDKKVGKTYFLHKSMAYLYQRTHINIFKIIDLRQEQDYEISNLVQFTSKVQKQLLTIFNNQTNFSNAKIKSNRHNIIIIDHCDELIKYNKKQLSYTLNNILTRYQQYFHKLIVVSRNGLRGDNYNSPLFYDLDKKYKDQWKINKRKGIKKDVKKKEIGELCSPLNINGNDDEQKQQFSDKSFFKTCWQVLDCLYNSDSETGMNVNVQLLSQLPMINLFMEDLDVHLGIDKQEWQSEKMNFNSSKYRYLDKMHRNIGMGLKSIQDKFQQIKQYKINIQNDVQNYGRQQQQLQSGYLEILSRLHVVYGIQFVKLCSIKSNQYSSTPIEPNQSTFQFQSKTQIQLQKQKPIILRNLHKALNTCLKAQNKLDTLIQMQASRNRNREAQVFLQRQTQIQRNISEIMQQRQYISTLKLKNNPYPQQIQQSVVLTNANISVVDLQKIKQFYKVLQVRLYFILHAVYSHNTHIQIYNYNDEGIVHKSSKQAIKKIQQYIVYLLEIPLNSCRIQLKMLLRVVEIARTQHLSLAGNRNSINGYKANRNKINNPDFCRDVQIKEYAYIIKEMIAKLQEFDNNLASIIKCSNKYNEDMDDNDIDDNLPDGNVLIRNRSKTTQQKLIINALIQKQEGPMKNQKANVTHFKSSNTYKGRRQKNLIAYIQYYSLYKKQQIHILLLPLLQLIKQKVNSIKQSIYSINNGYEFYSPDYNYGQDEQQNQTSIIAQIGKIMQFMNYYGFLDYYMQGSDDSSTDDHNIGYRKYYKTYLQIEFQLQKLKLQLYRQLSPTYYSPNNPNLPNFSQYPYNQTTNLMNSSKSIGNSYGYGLPSTGINNTGTKINIDKIKSLEKLSEWYRKSKKYSYKKLSKDIQEYISSTFNMLLIFISQPTNKLYRFQSQLARMMAQLYIDLDKQVYVKIESFDSFTSKINIENGHQQNAVNNNMNSQRSSGIRKYICNNKSNREFNKYKSSMCLQTPTSSRANSTYLPLLSGKISRQKSKQESNKEKEKQRDIDKTSMSKSPSINININRSTSVNTCSGNPYNKSYSNICVPVPVCLYLIDCHNLQQIIKRPRRKELHNNFHYINNQLFIDMQSYKYYNEPISGMKVKTASQMSMNSNSFSYINTVSNSSGTSSYNSSINKQLELLNVKSAVAIFCGSKISQLRDILEQEGQFCIRNNCNAAIYIDTSILYRNHNPHSNSNTGNQNSNHIKYSRYNISMSNYKNTEDYTRVNFAEVLNNLIIKQILIRFYQAFCRAMFLNSYYEEQEHLCKQSSSKTNISDLFSNMKGFRHKQKYTTQCQQLNKSFAIAKNYAKIACLSKYGSNNTQDSQRIKQICDSIHLEVYNKQITSMKPIKLNENTGIFDMEARLLMERVDAGKLLQKKKNYAIYNIEHGAQIGYCKELQQIMCQLMKYYEYVRINNSNLLNKGNKLEPLEGPTHIIRQETDKSMQSMLSKCKNNKNSSNSNSRKSAKNRKHRKRIISGNMYIILVCKFQQEQSFLLHLFNKLRRLRSNVSDSNFRVEWVSSQIVNQNNNPINNLNYANLNNATEINFSTISNMNANNQINTNTNIRSSSIISSGVGFSRIVSLTNSRIIRQNTNNEQQSNVNKSKIRIASKNKYTNTGNNVNISSVISSIYGNLSVENYRGELQTINENHSSDNANSNTITQKKNINTNIINTPLQHVQSNRNIMQSYISDASSIFRDRSRLNNNLSRTKQKQLHRQKNRSRKVSDCSSATLDQLELNHNFLYSSNKKYKFRNSDPRIDHKDIVEVMDLTDKNINEAKTIIQKYKKMLQGQVNQNLNYVHGQSNIGNEKLPNVSRNRKCRSRIVFYIVRKDPKIIKQQTKKQLTKKQSQTSKDQQQQKQTKIQIQGTEYPKYMQFNISKLSAQNIIPILCYKLINKKIRNYSAYQSHIHDSNRDNLNKSGSHHHSSAGSKQKVLPKNWEQQSVKKVTKKVSEMLFQLKTIDEDDLQQKQYQIKIKKFKDKLQKLIEDVLY